MKKIISLLLLFTFGLSSCEKDDICDANTPTTPRLVISFYDIADPATPKNVKDLQVIGVDGGDPNGIVFNENGTSTTKYYANGNTISIPLRIDSDSTSYKFVYDALNTDPTAINTDILTFYYTRETVYVSRACGFKTTFAINPSGNSAIPDYTLVDGPNGEGFWMQNIDIKIRKIELEDETHVEILF